MQAYIMRPETVEACRFDGSNYAEIEAWSNGVCKWVEGTELHLDDGKSEPRRIDVGDFVVKNVDGVFFGCKAEVFRTLYDPAP